MTRSTGIRWWSAAAAMLVAAASAGAVTVLDVRVTAKGAAAVDTEAVLAHVGTRAGQEFDPNAVSRDVKSLEKTGRYSTVNASVEQTEAGVILIYQVAPRLRIRRLEIRGADYYSNKKIRNLMELGVGDLVDEAKLAVHVKKVTDAYREKYYPDATAEWKIEESPESGTADVTVKIKEGHRVKVRSITFPGAKHIKPRILRKVMTQKTTNIFSWLTGSGKLEVENLDADRLLLKQQFQNLGYLDAKVGEPEIKRRGTKRIDITVPVEEGRLYRIGDIQVEGVTLFPLEDVKRAVRIAKGDVASMEDIVENGQNVQDFFGSRGYINTRLNRQLDPDPAAGTVDITYRLTEGKLATIRNIEIRGNTRTQDKVIRRELSVYPGEIFNEVRVRQSERRLRNLGYFSYVGSSPVATDKSDAYDLIYEVEEQRSGQFVVGAGFSSVDDLIGFVELSQGNFDIAGWPRFTGAGQKFKVRLQLGTKRRDWQVSFVEPWFLDRRLALGLDVFQHDRRFLSDDYDQRNTGGSVSLTKPLPGPYRLKFAYSLQDIEVRNVDDDASDLIKLEEGSRIKSAGSVTLIRDTRDSVFIPTRGNRTTAAFTLAGGVFGGDTDLYELDLQSAQYFPLLFDHVFSLYGRVSTVEEYGDADRVPIFDRQFLGGSRTLRGFDYRDVGPKDETGEAIGGRSSIFGSVEYAIPVVEKVRVAAFYDVGMVYDEAYSFEPTDLNSDAGIGIRFDIPGFPLHFDYAWPLEADEFNDRSSGRFNFLIGYIR